MSTTPRTDAVQKMINGRESCHADDICTACDFARKLERELARYAWRTWESAPDERTRVLAAYFGVYEPCAGAIADGRFFPDGGSGSEPFTHWMPIPPLDQFSP